MTVPVLPKQLEELCDSLVRICEMNASQEDALRKTVTASYALGYATGQHDYAERLVEQGRRPVTLL